MRRALVTLSPETLDAVERTQKRGLENVRFGRPPTSLAETIRRLIILALENYEAPT